MGIKSSTLLITLALSLIIISGCSPSGIDPYAESFDFQLVVKASGIDIDLLEEGFKNNFKSSSDHYIKGENYLILGRIKNENKYVDVASDYFAKAVERTSGEEKAMLYESLASLLGSKYYHTRAAWEWKKLKDDFRYQLNLDLALGKEPELTFETSSMPYSYILINNNAKKIKIGEPDLILTDKDILVSQVDRVTRDWLSFQIDRADSEQLLSIFSEGLSYPQSELMPEIGWHEGGRIKEIKSLTGLTHHTARGTVVAKKDGKWYAPNEEGVFMFEVPKDKVFYPTTRPFSDNLAVIIDTHGINMIVGQAIKNKATVVMGCCDSEGKIKAAKYLSDKGISVICNTDRFLPLLLGSGANVFGSAPFERESNKVIIGNRPLEFEIKEPIVVTNVNSDKYALWYYDTSSRYFEEFETRSGIDLNIHTVELTDFNQMNKVIEKAEEINAKIISVRIFNKDDYENVKEWLEKDINHKAILFHSEAYPYGYKLAREFTVQTSFDDINPVVT